MVGHSGPPSIIIRNKVMKLVDVYRAIGELKDSLPQLFECIEITYPFENSRTPIGDWSDVNKIGMVVTGDDIGKRSGIYFFATPDEEVFYIGKAASLHGRVWDHVSTPLTDNVGKKQFPNHKFKSNDSTKETHAIEKGLALLGVAIVSNPNLVSLIEVYLHTVHIDQHCRLPKLNKQIG
jgi:hypothetical protein